ncbi:MAG TPA: hypothetical protein VKD22_08705, partial [Ramlibacter sp.]|nr:hypothetical protein [Ramlibacter sp.]
MQQQILENDRMQLLTTQHELLLQNACGLRAAQLELGRQLNAIGPSAIASPPAAVALPPRFNA